VQGEMNQAGSERYDVDGTKNIGILTKCKCASVDF